jgi:hypothetical protein
MDIQEPFLNGFSFPTFFLHYSRETLTISKCVPAPPKLLVVVVGIHRLPIHVEAIELQH